MTTNEIQKYIETYLRYNKTEDMKSIPFENIFGKDFDAKLLHETIGKELSSVTVDDVEYLLGSWHAEDGLFYLSLKHA